MFGEMAEWSIASDLKSDELYRFREFESHSLLYYSLLFTSSEAYFINKISFTSNQKPYVFKTKFDIINLIHKKFKSKDL